ncbi:hypothetical protein L4C38_19000 [Vibrio kasasachensis]|uniref:tetratricopeptide repeat protein n=1 Tax=Vibrio kasasachensis TaxID=2910248 RepID=UPI003D0E5943
MSNINKQLVSVALLLLLQGCAANGSNSSSPSVEMNLDTQEKLLEAANNNGRLIEFYKTQLKEKESEAYRLKLAQVYLSNFDAESALFTIEPLLTSKKFSIESAVIAGWAHIDLGQHKIAKTLLERAHQLAPQNGEVVNLLGIVYAEQGKLVQARSMFELARSNFYDDMKIKNNLALVDMLEGDRTQALQRLLSLAGEPNIDKQLQANLMLIMAKNGQREYVFDGLDSTLSTVQKDQIYRALRDSSFQVIEQNDDVIIDPIVMEPAVIVPVASNPVSLDFPVTESVISEPMVFETAVIEPNTSQSVVIGSGSVEAVVIEPETSEQAAIDAVAIEPETSELVAIEPVVIELETSEQAAIDAVAIEPETSELVAIDPVVIELETSEQAAIDALAIELETSEQVAIEPIVIESDVSELVAVEPVVIEPEASELVAIEPTVVAPEFSEPEVSKSVDLEPSVIEPLASESRTLEPIALEPVVIDPTSVEPVAVQPEV